MTIEPFGKSRELWPADTCARRLGYMRVQAWFQATQEFLRAVSNGEWPPPAAHYGEDMWDAAQIRQARHEAEVGKLPLWEGARQEALA